MFLLHLLRLLLMTLFQLLLSRGIGALLRPLMFFFLLLLQFLVFLVLLLSQPFLLLLVFLIRVRLGRWRAVLRHLVRVVVSCPVICFRPAGVAFRPIAVYTAAIAGVWRPVRAVISSAIVFGPVIVRGDPIVLIRRPIRPASATVRWRMVIALPASH